MSESVMTKSSKVSLFLFLIACLTLILAAAKPASAKQFGVQEDAHSLKASAFEHYINGEPETALNYYQQAAAQAEKEYGQNSTYVGDIYYEMGAIAMETGKFSKAQTFLTNAVNCNPNSIMARVKLANLLRLKGQQDHALQQIQEVLNRHRDSPVAREALVDWLQENGSPAQAIHESFQLAQEVQGLPVPAPVIHRQVPVAKVAVAAPPPKPAEEPAAEKPAEKPQEEKKAENTTTIGVWTLPFAIPGLTKKPEPKAKPKPAPAPVERKHHTRKPEQVRDRRHRREARPVEELVATQKSLPRQAASVKTPRGLVPPPPPMIPVFPTAVVPQQVTIKTDAKQVKKAAAEKPPEKAAEKPREKVKEPAAESPRSEEKPSHAGSNTDDGADFMLDWASVKGKKGK